MEKAWIQDVCWGIIVYTTRCLTLWYIVGSFHLFFSGVSIFGSLAGLYALPRTLCIWFFISLARFFTHTSLASPMQLLSVYHIPTQAAAWYWKIFEKESTFNKIILLRVIMALIPLVCMGLFIAHPVGRHAASYTLYWLIPVCIAMIPSPHRWLRALGSTFTAHAIGSVLWIWTHPAMSAAMWLSLIPVVAYERLLFATMIWGASLVIDLCLVLRYILLRQGLRRTLRMSGFFSCEGGRAL